MRPSASGVAVSCLLLLVDDVLPPEDNIKESNMQITKHFYQLHAFYRETEG